MSSTTVLRRAPVLSARRLRGASLVEAMVVLPTFLIAVLTIWQAALVFYARSNVNYAAYEAARAASVDGASLASMNSAFERAMVAYYGGGSTPAELLKTLKDVALDAGTGALRIEVLSPTVESFQDFNSPALQAKLNVTESVIPNAGLDELTCPRDVAGCNGDPTTNQSGQTLLDANLLKLRVTFGIPASKQLPLVGNFYSWAAYKLGVGSDDPVVAGMLAAGRIPVVSSTVIRMQSDIVQNSAMTSSPGKGNEGTAVAPAPPASSADLPSCPWWDPACSACKAGSESAGCSAEVCQASGGTPTPSP